MKRELELEKGGKELQESDRLTRLEVEVDWCPKTRQGGSRHRDGSGGLGLGVALEPWILNLTA